jgi:hypothetical protein
MQLLAQAVIVPKKLGTGFEPFLPAQKGLSEHTFSKFGDTLPT